MTRKRRKTRRKRKEEVKRRRRRKAKSGKYTVTSRLAATNPSINNPCLIFLSDFSISFFTAANGTLTSTCGVSALKLAANNLEQLKANQKHSPSTTEINEKSAM